MAGDWIQMRTCLADEPEVVAIADACELDEHAVVGRLHCLWSWANIHTESGNAACVTGNAALRFIDRKVGVQGFAEAMIAVGWLCVDDGGITFPKFEIHNSSAAKTRAKTRERVRKHREKAGNATSVTKALPEKRTEESKSPVVPKGTESRDEGKQRSSNDHFESFWSVVHRKEARGAAEKAFSKAVAAVAKRNHTNHAAAAEWITSRMRVFAGSAQARDDVKGKIHPATWLNQLRFDDDDSVWGLRGRGGLDGRPPNAREEADRRIREMSERRRKVSI